MLSGAGGGTRTHTVSLPTDFESVTSANSITPADLILMYFSTSAFLSQEETECVPLSQIHNIAQTWFLPVGAGIARPFKFVVCLQMPTGRPYIIPCPKYRQ